MKKYKWIIILINLIILLGLFNNSILQKEELLTDGQLVLLELAPVDPRSLMQGDYMRLRYAISDNINSDSISKRGFCVVKLEENGIAKKVRIQENKTPINDNEFLIEYTSKKWRNVNIACGMDCHIDFSMPVACIAELPVSFGQDGVVMPASVAVVRIMHLPMTFQDHC